MNTLRIVGLSLICNFAVGIAAAQDGADAAKLIADVAAAARSTSSWVVEVERTAANQPAPSSLWRIWYMQTQPPRARQELFNKGDLYAIHVCDGKTTWSWYAATKNFFRSPQSGIAGCAISLTEWPALDKTMSLPTIAGTDRVNVNGAERTCTIVQGVWNGAGAVPSGRRICVDEFQRMILWSESYPVTASGEPAPNQSIARLTFRKIERNVEIPEERLQFRAPEGSVEITDPNVYRVGGGVSAPVVIRKVDPEYTKEAEAAGIEGTVLLYVEITPQGIASNIKIQKPLDRGLDTQAVECVKQWRFRPGMKDGVPVTVAATIEVNFRMGRKK